METVKRAFFGVDVETFSKVRMIFNNMYRSRRVLFIVEVLFNKYLALVNTRRCRAIENVTGAKKAFILQRLKSILTKANTEDIEVKRLILVRTPI